MAFGDTDTVPKVDIDTPWYLPRRYHIAQIEICAMALHPYPNEMESGLRVAQFGAGFSIDLSFATEVSIVRLDRNDRVCWKAEGDLGSGAGVTHDAENPRDMLDPLSYAKRVRDCSALAARGL
jgi:hypothetical protein